MPVEDVMPVGSDPVLRTFSSEEEIATNEGTEVTHNRSKKPSSSDMAFYYERLLPFRYVFQWLNHSPKPTKDFTMREFAYEFRSGAYQRYNSYMTLDEFKNLLSRPTLLVSKLELYILLIQESVRICQSWR